jgi:hypothetical protein
VGRVSDGTDRTDYDGANEMHVRGAALCRVSRSAPSLLLRKRHESDRMFPPSRARKFRAELPRSS